MIPMHARRSLLAAPAAAAAALLAEPTAAHGPTRQKVVEQIPIYAPAAKVWGQIRNSDALKSGHPAVEESPASKGNEEGSVRQLGLKGGGALPVTDYTSTIGVRADDQHAAVEWRGAFYRGQPNSDPPPDRNDEAAVAAVTAVSKAGLASLKTIAAKP